MLDRTPRLTTNDRKLLRTFCIAWDAPTPHQMEIERVRARNRELEEQQTELLRDQASLIRQRDGWYRKWTWTFGALLVLIAAHAICAAAWFLF